MEVDKLIKPLRRNPDCATLWSSRVINGKTPSNSKNNLCLTIKVVLLDVMSNKVNETFGR
ncbi:hypothetical protein CYL31_07640 [Marinomonas sp. A3A]|nr:hypothetical protein CYL31_07640 [Marinomonas sp. A3A]